MTIKLPIVSKGITINEIPGKTAVYFEFGNCNMMCPGCHSQHLWSPVPPRERTELSEMVRYAELEKSKGANAIVLIGGTTNRIPYKDLAKVIEALSEVLPVGIYSGAAVNSQATKFLKELPGLTWIKAGEYQKELGGLNSPGTNQRFYEKDVSYKFDAFGVYVGATVKWVDKTNLFQG